MSAQAYWLYLEAKQAAEAFDKKVYESLAEVRVKLINEETLIFVQNKIGNVFSFSTVDVFEDEKADKVIIKINANDQEEALIIDSNITQLTMTGEFQKTVEWSEDSLHMKVIELESETYSDSTKLEFLLKEKKEQLKSTLNKLAFEYAINDISIEQRIKKASVDSLLDQTFMSYGIEDGYQYEIRSLEGQILDSSKNFNPSANKLYRANLLESLDRKNTAILSIYFPSKLNSIIKTIWINLLISLLLSAILLGTFTYTLYSILKQKRLAQVKSDFINNMTHEFKTPIATISLAIDNMLHPLVRKDEKEIEKFGAIIKKENERMDQQIGRVLEIARLDKQEISLEKETFNIHQMVQEVIELFRVNIEENQGDINLHSKTESETIIGDKMHLFNALKNVIENGIKYSKGFFRITIHSSIDSGYWVVKISDKGIGMSPKTMKHIFDRFYRKTDGNLHETKGFGLGLFYTNNIIRHHQGSISATSKIGKGSEFIIKLPLS